MFPNVFKMRARKGFILLESLVTCSIVLITWYLITHCAVQAIVLEQRIEQKIKALALASVIIEKIRSGAYAPRDFTLDQEGMQVAVTCMQEFMHGLLHIMHIEIHESNRELLCLKIAVLKQHA